MPYAPCFHVLPRRLNGDDIEQLNVELEAIHYRCSDIYFEDAGDDEQASELLDSVGHSIENAVETLDGVIKLLRMGDVSRTVDRFYLKRQRALKRKRARTREFRTAVAGGGSDRTNQLVAASQSSH